MVYCIVQLSKVRAERVDCGESQARQVTSASGSTYLSLQAAQPNSRLIRNEKNEWNSVNMCYKLKLGSSNKPLRLLFLNILVEGGSKTYLNLPINQISYNLGF